MVRTFLICCDGGSASGSGLKSWLWWSYGALRVHTRIQSTQGRDTAREKLWLVKCRDREDNDVDNMREEHMAGHLARIEAVLDHIAMAGALKDPAGEKMVGNMLVYRTGDLEQAQAWSDGEPCARCGVWGTIEWSRLVLAARTLAGGVPW